jgi:large subunit ribosomal protein L29
MKVEDLRKMSVDELNKEHVSLLRESFNLRMRKGTDASLKSHNFRLIRRTIARILTILKEKVGK